MFLLISWLRKKYIDLFVYIDFGDIVRAKFDFDVVGHYARPDVLGLTVRDHPLNAVTFSSKVTQQQSENDSVIAADMKRLSLSK